MTHTLHPHTKRILELYLEDPNNALLEKGPAEWLLWFGGTYKLKEDREDAQRIYKGLLQNDDRVGWVEHILMVEKIKQI